MKTVVNKVGKIETTFRTFQMEVIAGENQLETQVVSIQIQNNIPPLIYFLKKIAERKWVHV